MCPGPLQAPEHCFVGQVGQAVCGSAYGPSTSGSPQPVKRQAEAPRERITVLLSPRRDHPGPVAHDCLEARGRGDPRRRSKGSGVDAELAVCGDEGDVSSV